MTEKNILFIAPIPPPISGHSLVSKILFKYLSKKNKVNLINLVYNSDSKGNFTFKRLFSVFSIFQKITKSSNLTTHIYLTISESVLGNIKDIIIYILLFKKLNKLIIHLHGGSIGREIFQKYRILKSINSFFYKRISCVIISGRSHQSIFSMVKNENIYIVPNFVQDNLFIDNSFCNKFQNINKIKVLYISSMDFKKGYWDLLIAIEGILRLFPNSYEFNFAGKFESKKDKEYFINRINSNPNIIYHGFVDDSKKKKLLHESHVFCLPTRYFEGQPISILEAYASGCVVLTTSKPGILDIFEDNKNGYIIDDKSPSSIKKNIIKLQKNNTNLEKIAQTNLKLATENFQQDTYCKRIESLFHYNIN